VFFSEPRTVAFFLIDETESVVYSERVDLSLDHWKSLSTGERESTAKRLASSLPSGFAFDSVQCLNSVAGDVAFFRFEAAKFALIPGGLFRLGFDAERQWNPTPEELESWQITAAEYGLSGSIDEHVVAATLRPRQVELAPFLIETTAGELGWESVGVEDDEVQSILKKYQNTKRIEVCRGERSTRVHRKDDGSIIAERSITRTHAELAEQSKASGFRFPASDEWEYVCGCVEPTLFRWGDHAPCDRYPTDISLKEAEYRKQRVASGGKLKPSPGRFVRDWDLHVKPNAFGIFIASNPYHSELVAEIGITRGGDGGCTVCGGYGFFVGWLTLATAYFEEHSCKHAPAEPISPGYTVARRVLDLR